MLERARAVRLGRKAGAGDSAVRDLHRYLAASTFTGQAQGERQSERREIGLGGLKAGAYVLTVTVHAGGGAVARAASILITKH